MKPCILRNSLVVFLFLVAVHFPAMACETNDLESLSQRQRDSRVASLLRQTGTCLESEYIALCAASDEISATELQAFLALADDGAWRIRSYLGSLLDIPGGNSRRVEIFVASCVGISHTTGLNEPWMFIPSRAVLRRMAPYLHELVHVMAQWSWRKSEWVAEGFANHVASRVTDGHAGYNRSFILPDGLARLTELYHSPAGQELLPLLGIPGRVRSYSAEHYVIAAKLTRSRREYGPAYYAMTWSFVDFLLTRISIGDLREVAQSDNPSDELVYLTGKSMERHIFEWLNSLPRTPSDG